MVQFPSTHAVTVSVITWFVHWHATSKGPQPDWLVP